VLSAVDRLGIESSRTSHINEGCANRIIRLGWWLRFRDQWRPWSSKTKNIGKGKD